MLNIEKQIKPGMVTMEDLVKQDSLPPKNKEIANTKNMLWDFGMTAPDNDASKIVIPDFKTARELEIWRKSEIKKLMKDIG